MYKNVSSDIMPYDMSENIHNCMSDEPEEEIPIGMGSRSFTYMKPKQLWANGVVPWSFVSNGDEYARDAATTDVKVGLSKGDVETVEAAMKQIEDKTCIRFEKVKPVRGEPWLFITRDNKGSDLSCQLDYIKDELVGKNIKGLGYIYKRLKGRTSCSPRGAYAWYGSSSPQNLGISQIRLNKNNQGNVGLMIHEILHNLGLGHTQKRQDASEHITIIKDNIKKSKYHNYEPCKNNPRCVGYNNYSTAYDCMSIMHYRDYFSITDEARKRGGKTMYAKNKDECDLSSPNTVLTNADVNILNRMYCANIPSVDGGWSDWSGFSSCSNQKDGEATCRKRKVRYCDNPPAQQGGAECIGDAEIFEDCEPASIDPSSNPDCVLYGGWTAWSDNSVCSESCTATRTRTCSNPRPFNYKECDGAAREISDCTGGDCPSSSAGIIRSPNYPDNYPHQQDLTIPIEVPAGSKIKLSFTTFDIEYEWRSCNFDYVKVVDSDGITELAKLCGPNIPSPIISSGNKLLVIFHSDGSENRKGFEASWKISAGEVSSGEVSSPGYPSLYSDNLNIMKTIHVAEGSKIELTITALDIEEDGGSCPYDHLTVYDGETTNDVTLAELCGFTAPDDPIVSTGNTMTLVFVTDFISTYKGYKGTWKQI